MAEEHQRTRTSIISETVLIALVPALAYGIGFAFEAGYSIYFRIPSDLISISLFNFFISLMSILMIIGLLFYTVMFIFSNIDAKHKFMIPVVLVPVVHVGLASFIWVIGDTWVAVSSTSLLTISLVIFLTLPIIDLQNQSYLESHRESIKRWVTKYNRSLLKFVNPAFNIPVIFVMLTLSLVFIIASMVLGNLRASLQTKFNIVTEETIEYVVLRIYEDTLILRSLDHFNAGNSDLVIIRKLNDDRSLTLERREIGPFIKAEDREPSSD